MGGCPTIPMDFLLLSLTVQNAKRTLLHLRFLSLCAKMRYIFHFLWLYTVVGALAIADRLKQSVKSKVNLFLFRTIHSNETPSAALSHDTVVLTFEFVDQIPCICSFIENKSSFECTKYKTCKTDMVQLVTSQRWLTITEVFPSSLHVYINGGQLERLHPCTYGQRVRNS